MLKQGFDWIFRDRRTGRIVIAQWPNLWLWLFIACFVAETAAGAGPVGIVAGRAGQVVLAVWAGDELLRGVNPWRRCLGAAVLLGIAIRLVP